MNAIYLVEKSLQEWISCWVEPEEADIWKVGEALGQPTRKRDAVIRRYNEVFNRLVQKSCVELGEERICIYSWNPRAYVRYFPVSLHATGTILRFKGKCEVEVLAYPTHRTYDPEVRGVQLPLGEEPVEVTERVDGWQITAYYDPVLKRWMFATRYVLHNMYYERGRLVVREYGDIVNPYVEAADAIASELGLYNRLKGREGWTFTFILKGPEPAVTRPPPPILVGDYLNNYRLLLVNARKPDGTLLTVSESGELLGCETVPLLEFKGTLRELLSKVERRINVRSVMARMGDDSEAPATYELKSKYYPEAMRLKHLYDAKSYSVLALNGLHQEALLLVDGQDVRDVMRRMNEQIGILETLLSSMLDEHYERLEEAILGDERLRPLVRDLRRARESGDVRRALKKMVALILEGKSVLEGPRVLDEYIERLRRLKDAGGASEVQ